MALVFLTIRSFINFLRNQIFSAGPLFILAFAYASDPVLVLVIGAFIVLLLTVGRSILFYYFFRFQVFDDQIKVRQGALNREDLTLHYDRIQNVNLSVPFYYLPFNLVNCRLDSAGSTQAEVVIPGIDREIAEDLQSRVLSYQSRFGIVPVDDEGEVILPESGAPLLRYNPFQAFLAGIINARVLVLASFIFAFLERSDETIDYSAYFERIEAELPHGEMTSQLLFYAALFGAIVGIVLLISAVRSMIQNFAFALYADDERLKRFAGLFERHQTSLRKSKVQGITFRRNLRAIFFRKMMVTFHQVTSLNSPDGTQSFAIPMISKRDWHSVIKLVFEDFEPAEKIIFTPPHRRYATRNFFMFIALPLSILFGLSFVEGLTPSWLVRDYLPWLLIPGWLACWQVRRRHGIWYNDDYVIIRSGFLGVRYTAFPIFKMQSAFESHTPMQINTGLKDLGVQLAYTALRVPWLPREQVERFINRSLYIVETSKRAWL